MLPEATRRGCWSSPSWLTVMADGSEFDAQPGHVTALPQGHDAWMAGEAVIAADWYGASNYVGS